MPYMVNKPFKACGRRLEPGEVIEADSWKAKNSLLSLGWISYIHKRSEDGSGISDVSGVSHKGDVSAGIKNAEVTGGLETGTETTDALTCPDCGKKCGNKAALAAHMKTHDVE